MSEEADLIQFLKSGTSPVELTDDLHRRISAALQDPSASGLDRAVLVRHLLRRWSLRDGRDVPVDLTTEWSASIREASATVGLRERANGRWFAAPWRPEWLELHDGVPDAAAMAGTWAGVRFHEEPLRADPFFAEVTGFDTYRTAGQRAACRAVMSAPEGSTVISMLPTGSGKTEIALCLSERRRFGLTVIVVPTVALAYDFERRFRDYFSRRNTRVRPESLHFAWTASTDEAIRVRLRSAISQGQQPLLVTSPESMTRTLRQTLLEAASIGRLQGFVVDEAHLVTQWGRDFRPEFRTLADLRRDLLDNAADAGHDRPVTLLLSATLGTAEVEDLTGMFGAPGPCSPIVANALRSEPDIWIAQGHDAQERDRWVLDALAHCARPAILYVTSPTSTERWLRELHKVGYSRVAPVSGATSAVDRSTVLDGIRAQPGGANSIDLVVATSAFGLGIDYPHIRTIVHACLPETVDRWYQEMGRGGRDGAASAEFLLTAPGDGDEAASLGTKVLTPAKAKARWNDLWAHGKEVRGLAFVDLEGSRGVGRGDYNRRWNAQLIQGLVELGELRRDQFDVEDIRELLDDDSVESSDWTAVRLATARMGLDSYWDDVWLPWQQRETTRSFEALDRIRDVSRLKVGACSGIAAAYAPGDRLLQQWGECLQWMEPLTPCGRCPQCRRDKIPPKTDPPPAPKQVWAVGQQDLSDLAAFAQAARAVNGFALLTYRPGEEALAGMIAAGLVDRGVRHLAGIREPIQSPPGEVLFVDEAPLSPVDLTPVSTFSFFVTAQSVSRHWLSRRASPRVDQGGAPLVDVVLVPVDTTIGGRVVGRDLPSIAGVTAAELLRRW